VHIGADLDQHEKEMLEFLNEGKEVFAWSTSDLKGVGRDLAQRNLNVSDFKNKGRCQRKE
jgi:hypothetical protein